MWCDEHGCYGDEFDDEEWGYICPIGGEILELTPGEEPIEWDMSEDEED